MRPSTLSVRCPSTQGVATPVAARGRPPPPPPPPPPPRRRPPPGHGAILAAEIKKTAFTFE
jgi:hypothetical protein